MSNESEGNMGQTSLQLEQERDPLDSWKEIAAYLNRNVRTVQRWEKREGLPIHRHVHERASSVSAYKKEIDAWQKQRSRVSDEITENQRELRDWVRVGPIGNGKSARVYQSPSLAIPQKLAFRKV